jgi:hypothetical protein
MKFRPRFSLRTLFVLVAIASVPMGWVAYQLNWIRQRHEFLMDPTMFGIGGTSELYQASAPWQLSLFGEKGEGIVWTTESRKSEAAAMFPEAHIHVGRR